MCLLLQRLDVDCCIKNSGLDLEHFLFEISGSAVNRLFRINLLKSKIRGSQSSHKYPNVEGSPAHSAETSSLDHSTSGLDYPADDFSESSPSEFVRSNVSRDSNVRLAFPGNTASKLPLGDAAERRDPEDVLEESCISEMTKSSLLFNGTEIEVELKIV